MESIYPIDGVRLASLAAGIKYAEREDLCVIEICEGASVSGVFTQNAFCAAPVHVAKQNQNQRDAQQKTYFLINSGNANAGTGERGMANALETCALLAASDASAEINPVQVLPFSTGVIGEQLPMDRFDEVLKNIDEMIFDEFAWPQAAQAIMTTDTRPKLSCRQFELSNGQAHLSGIAKGSGMIKPNMATMLAYLATDLKIEQSLLDDMLKHAADLSFNCISVDGDTSTNDAFMLVASGKGAELIPGSDDQLKFQEMLNEVSIELAQAIVRDGEGATKFIEVSIQGGKDALECKEVAYTIAHSPLVKTAFFASDPNWGRILAALGRAPIDELDLSKVDIYLGDVSLILAGELVSDYSESAGQKVMDQKDIVVSIDLGRGEAHAKVWTCDFSYDYVKINAEYRS